MAQDKEYILTLELSDGSQHRLLFSIPPGEKGEKGEKGDRGERGDKGERGEKGADGSLVFEELTEEQKALLKGDKGEVDYAVVDNAILEVLVVFDLAPMLLDADGAVLCDKNDEILVNM